MRCTASLKPAEQALILLVICKFGWCVGGWGGVCWRMGRRKSRLPHGMHLKWLLNIGDGLGTINIHSQFSKHVTAACAQRSRNILEYPKISVCFLDILGNLQALRER